MPRKRLDFLKLDQRTSWWRYAAWAAFVFAVVHLLSGPVLRWVDRTTSTRSTFYIIE